MAKSIASEALRVVTERDTQTRVAARLAKRLGRNVEQSRVSIWVRGLGLPSSLVMIAIQAEYGIQLIDWTLRPKRARAKRRAAAAE